MRRISLMTGLHCRPCAMRGLHVNRRTIRLFADAPGGSTLVEPDPSNVVLYCPNCDGPLASIDCENPQADRGAPL